MLKWQIFLSLLVTSLRAAPGYDFGLHDAPLLTLPGPIYSPPLLKAPILAPAPILKTVAPVAPIIKTIAAPATSYASITRFHVAHPAPIVKTILAPQPIYAPQPLLKSYYPQLAIGHGYH